MNPHCNSCAFSGARDGSSDVVMGVGMVGVGFLVYGIPFHQVLLGGVEGERDGNI